MSNEIFNVGVDIGKTKIAIGVLSGNNELKSTRVIMSSRDAETIISSIHRLIASQIRIYGNSIKSIGIASCGVVDPIRGVVVSSGYIKNWNNVPLTNILESVFNIPVFVENDVNAALYGEYMLRKDYRGEKILYLSFGTSIGLSYIDGGSLLRGNNYSFGEIWDYHLREQTYSLGELLGGGGISKQYYDKTGVYKKCEEVFASSKDGDSVSGEIIRQFIVRATSLITWLRMCFDPSCIILGGGMICNNAELLNMLINYSQAHGIPQDMVVPSALGVQNGLYGAALLSRKKLTQSI